MAVRYVEIGQYPDVRREVRGNLSEILVAAANPGTYAAPEDVTGCFLEMGLDGLWTGASVGTMPKATADALYASGALASVAVGTPYRDTAGTSYSYQGAGVGWGAENPAITIPGEFNQLSSTSKYKSVALVVAPGASNSERASVESPCIFWDDLISRWTMLYTAYDNTTGTKYAKIWKCNSDDLVVWDSHAIFFQASGTPGAPDQYGTTGPVMVIEAGVYYLFYIGLDAVGYEGGTPRLCLATSTDMKTWTRLGAVISPIPGSHWGSNKVWHSNFVKRGSVWYCFINGTAANGVERVGVMVSQSLAGPWVTTDTPDRQVIADQNDGFFLQSGDPFISFDPSRNVFRMDYSHASVSTGWNEFAETTREEFPYGWKRIGKTVAPNNPTFDYGRNGFSMKPWIVQKNGLVYHYFTSVPGGISLAVAGGQIVVDSENCTGAASGYFRQFDSRKVVAKKAIYYANSPAMDLFEGGDSALNAHSAKFGGTWSTTASGANIVSGRLVWSGSSDCNATLAVTLGTSFQLKIEYDEISAGSYPIGFMIGSIKAYQSGGIWTVVGATVVKQIALLPPRENGTIIAVVNGTNLKIYSTSNMNEYSEYTLGSSPAGAAGIAFSGNLPAKIRSFSVHSN